MKIGFWFDYDQTWTFTALFHALRERLPGLKTCGFVMNDRYFAHARDNLPPSTRLERLYEHYNAGLAAMPSAEQLRRFAPWDTRLKLARIAYSDRYVQDYPHDRQIALYIHLRDVFEAFLDAEKPDAFVFNCIASGFAHLFYELLRERGIRVLVPSPTGVADLIYMADNPFIDCPEVWESFTAFRSGVDAPTAEEAAFAGEFCARIVAGRPAYDNLAVAVEGARYRLPSPLRILHGLANHWRYYRTDPTQPGLARRLVTPIVVRLRRRRVRRHHLPLERATERPFLFVPLHYEPEIATLVISPGDQRSTLDIIARRLPLGWRIVAKEHPAMVGRRDPAFFDDIAARNPNVVFVDPAAPTAELIRRCEALFTLTGTAALEATILGKPTILQAQSRFGGLGLIPRMTDPFAFDDVLDRALGDPPKPEEAELAVAAFRRHCHRFLFAEPLGCPAVLEPANIAALRDATLATLRRG